MNIIEQIVQIDSIAQKELDAAYKTDKDIQDRTKKIMNEDKATVDNEINEELKVIKVAEEQKAKEAEAKIKAQTDTAIEKLVGIYEKNHTELEKQVYNSILE